MLLRLLQVVVDRHARRDAGEDRVLLHEILVAGFAGVLGKLVGGDAGSNAFGLMMLVLPHRYGGHDRRTAENKGGEKSVLDVHFRF